MYIFSAHSELMSIDIIDNNLDEFFFCVEIIGNQSYQFRRSFGYGFRFSIKIDNSSYFIRIGYVASNIVERRYVVTMRMVFFFSSSK